MYAAASRQISLFTGERHTNMHISVPEEPNYIIDCLQSEGYDAYVVGGCVRDSLLGLNPNDWDITTSAQPEEIKQIFKHTIDTGIEHGTVTVRKNHKSYEVTTYRIDGDYTDARHPDSVTFTNELKEDLRRRDFTINAMAYNDRDGLVDIYGGREDLKNKIIRCVGEPKERFDEDALRMLRAVRFSAQLGFEIEDDTAKAIELMHENLKGISAERICTEVIKLITSDHPEIIRKLYEFKLSDVFFPELNLMMETPQNTKHHITDVGEHTILVMQRVSPEKVLRLAALFHDVGKPVCRKTDGKDIDHFVGHPQTGEKIAANIMHRWKLDNATIKQVSMLVRIHDERPNPTPKNVRRFISRNGKEILPKLFELKRADIFGQSEYRRKDKLELIDTFESVYFEIINAEECVSISQLCIDGKDVVEKGIKPGPQIGEILKALLEWVLEDPSRNERELLVKQMDLIIKSEQT